MIIANNLKFEVTNQSVLRLLEVFISVSIMIALNAVVVRQVSTYSTKAQVSEVFTNFSYIKEQVMNDYVQTGYWPTKIISSKEENNQFDIIEKIVFDGKGTINYYFDKENVNLSGVVLSFVASRLKNEENDKIVWICGYATALPGFERIGINKTNIKKNYLPEFCQ